MSLCDFIRLDIDSILESWEEFARTRLVPARHLSLQELRDHAKELLLSIADDIEASQSGEAQQAKSRGERPHHAPRLTEIARQHAQNRYGAGFDINEMVAEYRALRASVQRIWASRNLPEEAPGAYQLVRFNEAMDQGLTESIACFSQRLEASRDLLLAVLGHDLRTPLGAVRGSAQYLLRTEALDGLQAKAATRILDSAQRMAQMVSALLDFTRTRLGLGLAVVRAPGHLGLECEAVVEELRALYPDRVLRLRRSGDLAGDWDLPRLKQMVSNLVANALQHGDPRQAVTVDLREAPPGVEVVVHNEGRAIPEAARKTLFEPLKRDTGQGHEGSSGLGLGLFIAHEIARAHGGDIEMESSDAAGTTFTVRLPSNG